MSAQFSIDIVIVGLTIWLVLGIWDLSHKLRGKK